MEVTLKEAFSILDGRLSTEMGKVHEMINYVSDANLFTHQLPEAMIRLKEKSPLWFKQGVDVIQDIKEKYGTDDFTELMKIIDSDYPDVKITIERLKKL